MIEQTREKNVNERDMFCQELESLGQVRKLESGRLQNTDFVHDIPQLRKTFLKFILGFAVRLFYLNVLFEFFARKTQAFHQAREHQNFKISPYASLKRSLLLEWELGSGFHFLPVAFGLGAIVYFAQANEPEPLALIAGLVVLSIGCWLARDRFAWRLILLGSFTFVLGMALSKLETSRFAGPVIGSPLNTTLIGQVVSVEHLASGRKRMVLNVHKTLKPNLTYQPARVRLSARKIPADLMPGDMIEGRVRLMPPTGPVRIGGYDFSFTSYFNGFGGSGFFLTNPLPVKVKQHSQNLQLWQAITTQKIRQRLTTRITSTIEGQEGAVAAALVTGAKSAISKENQDALRAAGLAHILSISGLHMMLVAGVVVGLIRSCFALFPEFCARYPVRKYAASLALLAGFIYLFISGGNIATQRAFIMLGVMLVALIFDRMALTIRNLAIAALIVLLLSPHSVVLPGFQMSFAATAALIAFYRTWSRFQRKSQRNQNFSYPVKLMRYFVGIITVSLVAGGATSIYSAYHFNHFAPLGPIANLLAMPIVSMIVMPAGVIAHLMMIFDLDGPFLAIMGWGIGLVLKIAHSIESYSTYDVTGEISKLAYLSMSAALVIACLLQGRLRLIAVPIFICAIVFLFPAKKHQIYVSEDGKLIAFLNDDKKLVVNRARPNRFVMSNWRSATRASQILKPQTLSKKQFQRFVSLHQDVIKHPPNRPSKAPKDSAQSINILAILYQKMQHAQLKSQTNKSIDVPLDVSKSSNGFICYKKYCLGQMPNGALIAQIPDVQFVNTACAIATVIIINDATATHQCARRTILTNRDLALHGTAQITIESTDQMLALATHSAQTLSIPAQNQYREIVHHAIDSQTLRPWHRHRVYLRAARGLAPWKPKPRKLKSVKPQPVKL